MMDDLERKKDTLQSIWSTLESTQRILLLHAVDTKPLSRDRRHDMRANLDRARALLDVLE